VDRGQDSFLSFIRQLGGIVDEDDIKVEQIKKNFRNFVAKYENNPLGFFKAEIDKFHRVSDQVIRKIGKLYDMAQDDTQVTESIIDWELHMKLQQQKCGGFLYLCVMEKLLTSLFLQAIFKDVKTTKALVDIIYSEPPAPKVVKSKVVRKPASIRQPVVKKQMVVSKPVEVAPVSDKKREVMEAIQYLKNKNTKTKADREKIQMLEVILKSV
jgi:hypothetical protein